MFKPKKLVVWDGDDTLWDGTLTAGDKVTIKPRTLQVCQILARRGVLQSMASSNLMNDVEEVLHRYGIAQLFLANQADLARSKAEMVKAIVEELDLSRFDDVLFIDDNLFNCSEVDVLGAATMNVVNHHSILAQCSKESYTQDDRDRVAMYRSQSVRKQAMAAHSEDRIKFLVSCEMTANIRLAQRSDLTRVVDLVARANRLGATERSYCPEELEEFIDSEEVFLMEPYDKFGKYGISGVVRVNRDCSPPLLTLMVISCRLRGMGYGSALLGWIINNLGKDGLKATWRETEYNAEVKALYGWYEFDIVKIGGICKAQLKTTSVSLPHWISITSVS